MIFCKNPDADVPILELYDQIGVTKDDWGVPYGIDGRDFADYLKFIEGQGKKGIDIYINSVGGSIIDGMTIVAAMKSCTIPVDTTCVGVAVSMAGVILQAGRKRRMVKSGLMMIHPPSGGDAKELAALKLALIKLLIPRTGMTENEMEDIMDETSWLNADQCLEMKLIDEITDITTNANLPELQNIENHARNLLKIVNSLKPKTQPKTMNNKCLNLLNLGGDATESEQESAIKDLKTFQRKSSKTVENAIKDVRKILNKKDEDYDDALAALSSEMDDLKKECKKMSEDKEKMGKECDALKKENDKLKSEMDDVKNAHVKTEAEDAVNAAINAGKIKAEVKAKWVDMYVDNKEYTKELLDAINGSKGAGKMPVTKSDLPSAEGKKDASNQVEKKSGISFLAQKRREATNQFNESHK